MSAKIALLIDAENMSYKDLPRILKEVSRQGEIVLHAIYADWDNPIMQKWKELAEKANFTLRHQSNHSQKKNASDMRLIMDAMEILYRTQVDTFCLVSNDADYVPLCQKLQESKKYVIGVGYQNASDALIRACNQYIFIGRGEISIQSLLQNSDALPEVPSPMKSSQASMPVEAVNQAKMNLQAEEPKPAKVSLPSASKPAETPKTVKVKKVPDVTEQSKVNKSPNLRKLITEGFAKTPQDANRWVTLTDLGKALRQIEIGFKPNLYGHANLTKLLKTMPDFVEFQSKGDTTLVRLKK